MTEIPPCFQSIKEMEHSATPDFELVFQDQYTNDEISCQCHREIVLNICPYFTILLTRYKEKDMPRIHIEVPNAYVAHDLIMKFHGKETNKGNLEPWYRTIRYIECCNFFGLDFDTKVLQELDIPPEGINFLIDLAIGLEFDKDVIKVINKMIPDDYDLSTMSSPMLDQMIAASQTYHLVSGTEDGRINIWNVQEKAWIASTNGHTNWVRKVCYSPNNRNIASASHDGVINIYDAETGAKVRTLIEDYVQNKKMIFNLCYSSDGKKIIDVNNHDIRMWDIETGLSEISNIFTDEFNTSDELNASCICYSPSNTKIVLSSLFYHRDIKKIDYGIKICDLESKKNFKLVTGSGVHSLCYSPDSKKIATGYLKSIDIWDVDKLTIIKTLNGKIPRITSMCYSPTRPYLAVGHYGGTISIWNVEEGVLINVLNDEISIRSICYSPDGRFVASGGYSPDIKIWDPETGVLTGILKGKSDVMDLCFSPKTVSKIANMLKRQNIFSVR